VLLFQTSRTLFVELGKHKLSSAAVFSFVTLSEVFFVYDAFAAFAKPLTRFAHFWFMSYKNLENSINFFSNGRQQLKCSSMQIFFWTEIFLEKLPEIFFLTSY